MNTGMMGLLSTPSLLDYTSTEVGTPNSAPTTPTFLFSSISRRGGHWALARWMDGRLCSHYPTRTSFTADSARLPHPWLSSPGRSAISNKSFGQMLLTCNLGPAIQPSTPTTSPTHVTYPHLSGCAKPYLQKQNIVRAVPYPRLLPAGISNYITPAQLSVFFSLCPTGLT